MKYYKALTEKHDYFTGWTTVKNELLTEREKNTRFPHLYEYFYKPVEVNKNKTFFSFGCRFQYKEEADQHEEDYKKFAKYR